VVPLAQERDRGQCRLAAVAVALVRGSDLDHAEPGVAVSGVCDHQVHDADDRAGCVMSLVRAQSHGQELPFRVVVGDRQVPLEHAPVIPASLAVRSLGPGQPPGVGQPNREDVIKVALLNYACDEPGRGEDDIGHDG
jgi:hypothetical protein